MKSCLFLKGAKDLSKSSGLKIRELHGFEQELKSVSAI